MLNLVLAILWLITGLGIIVYEFFNGPTGMRIKGLDVSSGWFFVMLSLYNLARWYSTRAWKAEQNALRIAHEERMRQVRYHERPLVPDPTFDFSDKPAPNVTDQPPKEPGPERGHSS